MVWQHVSAMYRQLEQTWPQCPLKANSMIHGYEVKTEKAR